MALAGDSRKVEFESPWVSRLPGMSDFYRRDGLAHGLPGAFYTSDEVWRRERDTLFADGWVLAGFLHELPKPGDARPVQVGGRPLLLLRDRKGEIRAFHNVCRHRCLKLVDAPGNLGAVVRCPYHSWVYGLDGQLRSTPYFGGPKNQPPEGFDPKEHGLVPARHQVWHDWIFVNLSGKAPPFEDFIAPLAHRLEGIDFAQVRPATTIDLGVVDCNWKFLMENFIEPYHVQYVHSTTTDQPLLDHATIIDGHCVGSYVDVKSEAGEEHTGSLAVSSRYLTLFPSFVLGRYFPDQLGVYLNVPLGPGQTAQSRVIYSTTPEGFSAEKAEALAALWTKVHREDHHMCERMQRGRASEVALSGGLLSPHWENSVRAFQELVVRSLG